MKKRIVIIVVILSIFLTIGIITMNKHNNTEEYTYEWVEEKESTIGQYRLYIKDSKGNHIDGKLDITYLNGKTETVEISKDGNLYVKTIIKDINNIKK